MSSRRNFTIGFVVLILLSFFVLITMIRDLRPIEEVQEPSQPFDSSAAFGSSLVTSGTAGKVPEILDSDPVLGSSNAQVTVVLFGDFECPFCNEAHSIALEVQQSHPQDVRLVWKDFPLPTHARARELALAARCAQDQDTFWEFAQEAFIVAQQECKQVEGLGCDDISVVASNVGVNNTRFATCVAQHQKDVVVGESISQGIRADIGGVPFLFVNDRPIAGLPTKEQLEAMVKEGLRN